MLHALLVSFALAPVQDSPDFEPRRYDPRWTPEVEVVREVAPAVVYVESSRPFIVRDFFSGQAMQRENVVSGSGVVIEKSGYIVTNYHVVGNDARSITVQFDPELDPKVYPAELVSFVSEDDLALLKIHGEREFPVVRRGTSSDLMIGERAIAIGNPFRQKLSVSAGIISGLHRDVTVANSGVPMQFSDLIQTDASINPGNSGGPLLNVLGELIGINTAVNSNAENMGFAIPVDRVEEVLRDHLLSPSASRAWLGFQVDEGDSFCVTKVTPESPAALAGMEPGNRLVAIDGARLSTAEDYRLRRLPLLPNQAVRVRVSENGAERDLILRGWDKVDGTLFERLGMTVEPFALGRYRCVQVQRVGKSGAAQTLGLQRGDVIEAVRVGDHTQAWRVPSPEAFASLVSGLAPKTELLVDILRDDDDNGRLERSELYKGTLVLD